MVNIEKIINNKILLTLVIAVSLFTMDFNQMQSPSWTAPYLSAAANFDFNTFDMYIDKNQVEAFSNLSKQDRYLYTFEYSDNIVRYDYLTYGFYFITIFATKVFFFLGDLDAIQLLQRIVHILLSLTILSLLKMTRDKILFFMLYAINPIILYFVNFPFYYFWQVVPSVVFIYYYLSKKRVGNMMFLIALVFAFVYITRPTILFLALLFFVYYGYKENWKVSLASTVLFFGLINIMPAYSFGPWHTMYVGIGGYENPYNIKLSDDSGYSRFYQVNDKDYLGTIVSNKEFRNEYYKTLKNEYIEIVKKEPFLIVKNGILNMLGAYAVGYKTGSNLLIYINILLGFIMICLLLYLKKYILFLAIMASSISFTPYYPPISAYMYGSYILIVIAFIEVVNYFIYRKYKASVKYN